MRKAGALILISVCLSVVVSIMVQGQFASKPIKSFDIKTTIDAYQNALVKKGASAEEQVTRISQFVTIINDVTEAYAKEHNVVIIVSAANIAGAEDITDTLRQRIIERYGESR